VWICLEGVAFFMYLSGLCLDSSGGVWDLSQGSCIMYGLVWIVSGLAWSCLGFVWTCLPGSCIFLLENLPGAAIVAAGLVYRRETRNQ